MCQTWLDPEFFSQRTKQNQPIKHFNREKGDDREDVVVMTASLVRPRVAVMLANAFGVKNHNVCDQTVPQNSVCSRRRGGRGRRGPSGHEESFSTLTSDVLPCQETQRVGPEPQRFRNSPPGPHRAGRREDHFLFLDLWL